ITNMTIDEKVTKIKKLVDNFLENCNIDSVDDKQLIDVRLKEFLGQENFMSKDELLNQIKILIKDDEKILLERGHNQSNSNKLIRELYNYCVSKCINEEELKFTIVIAVLLPDLIIKSYKNTVTNLIMQLS